MTATRETGTRQERRDLTAMTPHPIARTTRGSYAATALLSLFLATVALAGQPAQPSDGSDSAAKSAGAAAKRSCCTADDEKPAAAQFQRSVEDLAIPAVSLVDMDGRSVDLRAVLDSDQPILLNFIFTTCTTICPVMTATFSRVESTLREGHEAVRLVSISIDPERDTPARLREYATRIGAGPEWRFLTGTPAQIEAVQRAFGAYTGSKFNHSPLTFMRRPGASSWVKLEGLRGAEAVVAEYKRLMIAQ